MHRPKPAAGTTVLWNPVANAALLAFGYVVIIVVMFVALKVALLAMADDRGEIEAEPLRYNQLTCAAAHSTATRPLRAYVFNQRQARGVLDVLCDDSALVEPFSGVVVVWQHERAEVFAALQGDFDLLVAAPDIVARAPLGPAILAPIAGFADYEAVWLGRGAEGPLNADTLGQLRIGLLSSPVSMSGRVLPEVALRKTGIDVRGLDIRMYRRHEELRRALLDGDVDLIATYWNETADAERFRAFPRHAIGDAQGRMWYLERSLLDTALHCRVVDVLEAAAAEQTDLYFRALEVVRRCHP